MSNFKPFAASPAMSVSQFSGGNVLPGATPRVYLLPGQLHASAEPCQIITILGSCVAVCLFDATRLAGGMNHFILPISRDSEAESFRFADHATMALLKKLMSMGCKLENMTAKIFGGSALFQPKDRYAESLGAKNVAAALDLLKNAGIPIVAQETGGDCGRKVIFNTEEGVVWSRRVEKAHGL
jgi:chemotaxis protein CheD